MTIAVGTRVWARLDTGAYEAASAFSDAGIVGATEGAFLNVRLDSGELIEWTPTWEWETFEAREPAAGDR